MRQSNRVLMLVTALALLGTAEVVQADPNASPAVVDTALAAPGERELFARLVAPCCWNQTLDIHGGAVPDQLRAEIRRRLHAGEAPAAIEADFVARYGDRVRAHSSSATLGSAGLVVIGLMLLAGVGVGFAVRRWLRASARRGAELVPSTERDALDVRIDDELRALD